MKMEFLFLIMLVFASNENVNVFEYDTESGERNAAEQSTVVKIEEDEHVEVKKKTSNYIGVVYHQVRWRSYRHSKNERKLIWNGSYKDEETAAHASDTLVRKLIANGEKGHKLNFPDDNTEVYPKRSSNYIGVAYNKNRATWCACRWNKDKKKIIHNGNYKKEETAARASDTLARRLIANKEKGHKLNFPEDDTDVYPETERENYFGVNYIKGSTRWRAERWSKHQNKLFYNGHFKDKETAAHASDTLARQLIANGEKGHKLNFPDDQTEGKLTEYQKRKRKGNNNLGKYQDNKSYQNSI